jgi:hypothetical protein
VVLGHSPARVVERPSPRKPPQAPASAGPKGAPATGYRDDVPFAVTNRLPISLNLT